MVHSIIAEYEIKSKVKKIGFRKKKNGGIPSYALTGKTTKGHRYLKT